VGARAARSDAAAEHPAVRAALYAQQAGFAGWAFIDGRGTGDALRDRCHHGCHRAGVAATPEGLTAGRGADLLTASWDEGLLAQRARCRTIIPDTGIVTGIVTVQ